MLSDTSAEDTLEGWHTAMTAMTSLVVGVTSCALLLTLCAVCRRYSMDVEDYDRDNTQVIYNVSAGAKELPSLYTSGHYRDLSQPSYPHYYVTSDVTKKSNGATRNAAANGNKNKAQDNFVLSNPAFRDDEEHSDTNNVDKSRDNSDISKKPADQDGDAMVLANPTTSAHDHKSESGSEGRGEEIEDDIDKAFEFGYHSNEDDEDIDGLVFQNQAFHAQSP